MLAKECRNEDCEGKLKATSGCVNYSEHVIKAPFNRQIFGKYSFRMY